MQAALVSKIVVKHGLVRTRGRGDSLGARAGEPLHGEMLFRSGKNSPRYRRIFDLSTSAAHGLFQIPSRLMCSSGYRVPAATPRGAISFRRARSEALSAMSSAAIFSSRYFRRFVPGIGTRLSPLASTQAKAKIGRAHVLNSSHRCISY